MIAETYLEDLVNSAESNCVDLVVCGVKKFTEGLGDLKDNVHLQKQTISGRTNLLFNIDQMDYCFINLYCKLYRLDIIRNNKIKLDERLKTREDISFNLDYYSKIENCVIISQNVYYYRRRQDSLCHQVTLPTKFKYCLDHFEAYLGMYDSESRINALQRCPMFRYWFWDRALLPRFQANVLERNGNENREIRNRATTEELLKRVTAKNMNDKLFLFAIKNRIWVGLTILTKLKYYLLNNNSGLYDWVKSRMARK